MTTPKPDIGLSEFIEQVKKDLLESKTDEVPMFAVDKIEIEAKIAAKKEDTGKGGLKLAIFNFGVDAGVVSKSGAENTQTVKVTLSPLLTREEILEEMTPDQKKRIRIQARDGLMKGGGKEIGKTA